MKKIKLVIGKVYKLTIRNGYFLGGLEYPQEVSAKLMYIDGKIRFHRYGAEIDPKDITKVEERPNG